MTSQQLQFIQAVVIALMGGYAAYLAYKGKHVDSHISDNSTVEHLFETQSELLKQTTEENKKLSEQLSQVNIMLKKQTEDNKLFSEKIKELTIEVRILTEKLEYYENRKE